MYAAASAAFSGVGRSPWQLHDTGFRAVGGRGRIATQ
jgi:hypothetical protein